MKFRPVLVVAAVVLAIGANVYLGYSELTPDGEGRTGIAPDEVTVRHQIRKEDPLFDLQYLPARRMPNFQASYGLPAPLADRAVDRAAMLDDEYGRKLRLMLRDSEDPTRLLDAICGSTSESRPRYAMLRYLVVQEGRERVPLDLKRVSSLELQEWGVLAPIDTVYEMVEFADDRNPDATLMGIAAILAGQEEKVTKSQAPWGSGGLGRTWDWEQVVKEHPGIDTKVVEYVALMHVATEIAQAADGLCNN
ncbi:MAG: hypothetical protein VX265_11385 [Myxococcota bacterium]|nr:hypothetical protein [Myxococcota bacterium]